MLANKTITASAAAAGQRPGAARLPARRLKIRWPLELIAHARTHCRIPKDIVTVLDEAL